MTLVHALNLFALMASFSSAPAEFGMAPAYATEKEAATAAANLYNPASISQDREYMGAIYRTDAGFRFTVNAGRKRSDAIQFSIPKADFDSVVAFWHTHGDAKSGHRYFSNVDTQTVSKFGLPLYLADYTGYLKVFAPGDKKLSLFAASRLGLPRVSGYALGKVVKDKHRRAVRIATKQDSAMS